MNKYSLQVKFRITISNNYFQKYEMISNYSPQHHHSSTMPFKFSRFFEIFPHGTAKSQYFFIRVRNCIPYLFSLYTNTLKSQYLRERRLLFLLLLRKKFGNPIISHNYSSTMPLNSWWYVFFKIYCSNIFLLF